MLTETLIYMRDSTRSEDLLPVDLPSLLETICAERADLGSAITYAGPSHLVYRCQPNTLTRAVTNLIENGLKYGTRVKVTLRTTGRTTAEIDISDNGPGIPEAFREKVFEPFFKADSSRTTVDDDGFGLGLSIARSVIRAHGGEIELSSNSPRGTRVRIILPLALDKDRHPGSRVAAELPLV